MFHRAPCIASTTETEATSITKQEDAGFQEWHMHLFYCAFFKFTFPKILLRKNEKPAGYDLIGYIMMYKPPWHVKLNWISYIIMEVAGNGRGLLLLCNWKSLDGRLSVGILSKALLSVSQLR
jgi:hypothetical protein